MSNHPNRKQDPDEHARANAAGWYESISEEVAALQCDYDRLEELRDELTEVRLAESSEPRNTGTLENWAAEAADTENHPFQSAATEYLALTKAATMREHIQEGPLSVEVRSGWDAPGADREAPEEFCILLSTGGPALRLCGDLNEYGQPTRAYLQYQDWGTPWTNYYAGDGSGDILLTYAQQFYFGD